jgi:signal recognition particle receptor subunit beta
MSVVNFATKELTLKIVYYGPGLGGKTTNLRSLHTKLNPSTRSKMLSLATATDRTLFFDFLPVSLGKVNGYSVKIQLYTVPGQVYYNATRKLVLKGTDAVVFVASSQKSMRQENIDSLKNMWENLSSNNLDPNTIPIVIQYNKRDLPDIDTVNELNSYLNQRNYSFTEGIAIEGIGVTETFKLVTKMLLAEVHKKHQNGPARSVENKKLNAPSSENIAEQEIKQPQKKSLSQNSPNLSTAKTVKKDTSKIKNKVQSSGTSDDTLNMGESKKEKKSFIVIFIDFIKKLMNKKNIRKNLS